jgi:hypothetical protein
MPQASVRKTKRSRKPSSLAEGSGSDFTGAAKALSTTVGGWAPTNLTATNNLRRTLDEGATPLQR